MDRVQADEIASLQFARRLQLEYDNEKPQRKGKAKRGLEDRSILEDQKDAFEASAAQDKMKAKAREALAALDAKAAEAKAAEAKAAEAKAAAQEALEAQEERKPSAAEMRALRIKALSRPSAN